MPKIKLNVESNLGYAADQVQGITLSELAAAVEDAIDEYGEDVEVVLHQINNPYGANYGTVYQFQVFEPADDQDQEEAA